MWYFHAKQLRLPLKLIHTNHVGTGSKMSYLVRLASFLWDSERDASEAPRGEDSEASASSNQEATCSEATCSEARASGCTFHGRTASGNYWKHHVKSFDESLLGYETLHLSTQKLQLSAAGVFDVSLPSGKLSSKVLEHCCYTIEKACSQQWLFKIGVTADPHSRWYAEHGYHRTSFTKMKVMAILHFMEAAALLEASLIKLHKSSSLCLNQAPGGEGVSATTSPAFVYIVLKGR